MWSVCPRDFNLSPTGRWSGRTRTRSLRCVSARHSVSWPTNLPWVKHAHNNLVSSTTGMSLFIAACLFQPVVWAMSHALLHSASCSIGSPSRCHLTTLPACPPCLLVPQKHCPVINSFKSDSSLRSLNFGSRPKPRDELTSTLTHQLLCFAEVE